MTRGVGIIGLSGYEFDSARLVRATHYFESRGCRVRVLPRPDQSISRFAASDAARLAALDALGADDSLEIVIGLRGGYGLSRLLSSIDFASLAAGIARGAAKWVGHSDFTVLQLGLLAHSATTTLAGPLAGPDFGAESIDPFTEGQFWRMVNGERLELEWPCAMPPLRARGVLWGGNLAMLCSLVGTHHLPSIEGGLLFLEDTNEQPYRVERMLLQLEMAGILSAQSAILLGDFDGIREQAYDRGFSLATVIDYLQDRLAVPVVTGLPFGHGARKATLPVGALCDLDLDGVRARLCAAATDRA